MHIILKENFPSLGYVGDKVSVRRGYARNYLIPRGVAVEVGSENAKLLNHKVAGINAHKARLKKQADEIASRLANVKLEFVLKLGGQGKSFGTVTLKDIEDSLKAQGFELDRRQVRLEQPIKSGGTFEVQIRLHSEVLVKVPVHVTAEVVAAPVADEGAEGEVKEKRIRKKRSSKKTEDGEAAPAEEKAE